ncbi:MAG: restriction endonuclease [Mycobacterium sp.]
MKKAQLVACCVGFAVGWRNGGELSAGLAVAAALLVALWLVTAVAGRWRGVIYLMSGLRKVDGMSGPQFEDYVAAKFRAAGYRVSSTRSTGDFGVDLIVRKGNARIAVQCKRHGNPVGVAAVQQVVAGAVMHRCTSTMVVSNREFTPAAVTLARSHNCKLVGRSRLQTLPV